MIFILFFSWRGGGGGDGDGVLGVLIGGSEKKHIVILCWGTHWEPKKNEKRKVQNVNNSPILWPPGNHCLNMAISDLFFPPKNLATLASFFSTNILCTL